MGPAVGIDLGTTNPLVAYLEEGRPKIAPNQRGGRSTPSVVALDGGGRLVVGGRAKEELLGGREYTPTELSAIVLRALRADAERFAAPRWRRRSSRSRPTSRTRSARPRRTPASSQAFASSA